MNDLKETLNLTHPFLRPVLESHQSGIVILDSQLNISLCNPVVAHFLGYRLEECYQKAWLDLIHPEDKAIVHHGIQEIFTSSAETVQLSYRLLTVLSESFHAKVSMEAIREDNNSTLGILLKVDPLIPASLDQQKLFQIAENMAQIPDDSLIHSLVKNIAEVLEVSHVHVSRFDHVNRRVVPISLWVVNTYVPDFSYPLKDSPCEPVINNRQAMYFENNLQERFPNDYDLVEWGVVAYLGVPIINGKSELIGHMAVMNTDVIPHPELTRFLLEIYRSRVLTELERQDSEKASRESEAKLNSIFNSTQDLIYAVDSRYKLMAFNEPFARHYQRFFGQSPEIGINMVAEKGDIEWQPLFDRALSGEQFSIGKNYEFDATNSLSLSFNFTPIKGKEDQVIGCTIFGRNITELKKAKDVLKQKNKQLEKYIESNLQLEHFAYMASHDLREPLRTIGNFAQLLERRYNDKLDDDAREFISFITGGVTRMNSLVDDLLMYSRVNQGGYTTSMICVKELIREVVESLGQFVEEKSARIRVRRIPEFIRGNKTQLSQLFQNLIVNAIKFQESSNTPEVIVTAKSDGGLWKFSIADNGIGIKPEFQEAIFGLFKKLHAPSEYSGTGIGLAICRKIVEQHGGEIWAESVPGRGTTIHFTIAR